MGAKVVVPSAAAACAAMLLLACPSPARAADQISGTWVSSERPARVFIFKASGERFAGVACGPCDRAATVVRVEDGRISGLRISFVVSAGPGGQRSGTPGVRRDRMTGSIANGRLSLTSAPVNGGRTASALTLTRVVPDFMPDMSNVPASSLLETDPVAASSPIEGRWVAATAPAQQNLVLKVRGGKVWGVICGPCTPDVVALIDDGTFDGTTMKFYINHIDTALSSQPRGVHRNIMIGTVSGNVITFRWMREGAEQEPGGQMVVVGPIRD